MARKKQEPAKKKVNPDVVGLHAEVMEQPITETLQTNYMPYAMSVIVSRAIPEIDGFKPSHRKLLYTMFKMGLLTGGRTKSANIVGRTMSLNPHGDAAIYDTMVRLSKGYEALLTPFVDSKGNFGKAYSRDTAYAASRYTEAKLSPICQELFRDIDRDTVDFVDNYDGTLREPTLLPTSFPNVLVSANTGIAVGMASNICGFNLAEVCQTAIEYINNPDHNIMSTLLAPDFPTGGEIIYDADEIASIYETGRGSFKVRARWRYLAKDNLIEIYEIPYTTTVEAIIDKVSELISSGKIREISNMRDETDLSGLKLAIDIKRGTDPEKLMAKLFKQTPLLDSFACNFNILIAGMPRVLGIREILDEWIAWRTECVRRRVFCELAKQKDKLHLLYGLKKILLDIDKAIEIIRNTEAEADVVPNLMIGFGIDEAQAEFVAEIKLRNINREYILKRTDEVDELEKQIADLEDILKNRRRVKKIISDELSNVIKKYGAERRTKIVYNDEIPEFDESEQIDDYPVTLFLSREGYFKKITPLSLRMGGEQKYKENDSLRVSFEATNRSELLIFTDRYQVYKTRASDFDDTKASALGSYLPAVLSMDDGENAVFMVDPKNYTGQIAFFFENGKALKTDLAGYATKQNRKKLTGAYSDKSPLKAIIPLDGDIDVAVYSTDGRAMIFNTKLLAAKASRASQGVTVMALKKKSTVEDAAPAASTSIKNYSRYKVRSIPAAGALLRPEDRDEIQLQIGDLTDE
ncbi:MAG: topoisomerase IV [Oscillospiraceae bacterium]|nr:topoisomerase IV [Oscillospiraceae bacterium]